MVMSCCGLPTPGSMMVTCVSARPPDCAGTTLANPNSVQSANRERKIDLKRWDRIAKLDTKRESFVPARDETFFLVVLRVAEGRFHRSCAPCSRVLHAVPCCPVP